MALRRCLLQIGTGADLHGADSTKAAQRAVTNAVMNVGDLGFMRVLGRPHTEMHVHVTIGVPRPETVNKEAVLSILRGQRPKSIDVVTGGLEVKSEDGRDSTLIANATVVISVNLPD